MKKTHLFILFSFFMNVCKSQTLFPVNQPVGNAATNNLLYTINGGGYATVGFIDSKFNDTTQANLNSYLKWYAGARFYSISDEAVWVRNSTKTMWLKQATGSSGSGTVQSVSGLSPLFTVLNPTTTPTFAQISQSQNLVFASPNGSSGNPSFRALVAGDLPAAALTNIYNTDGTLTAPRTLNGGGNNLTFTNMADVNFATNGGGEFNANGFGLYSFQGGNFGIGLATPSYKLHVETAAGGTSVATIKNTSGGNGLTVSGTSTSTQRVLELLGGAGGITDLFNVNADGKIYANLLPSGIGNKSVRWNNSTKELTYADTTTSSGGTVTGVTATSPLASSGGTTPNISLPITAKYIPFGTGTSIGKSAKLQFDSLSPKFQVFTYSGSVQLGDSIGGTHNKLIVKDADTSYYEAHTAAFRIKSTTTDAEGNLLVNSNGLDLVDIKADGEDQIGIIQGLFNHDISFGTNGTGITHVYSDNGIVLENSPVYLNTSLGIGPTTSIAPSALADFVSTTKGLLIPRMNTTEQNAISSPATGLIIWNTDTLGLVNYTGSAWLKVSQGGGGSTPGIDDVLAVGQSFTTDRTINKNGNIFTVQSTTGGQSPIILTVGDDNSNTQLNLNTNGVFELGGLEYAHIKTEGASSMWIRNSTNDLFLGINTSTPTVALEVVGSSLLNLTTANTFIAKSDTYPDGLLGIIGADGGWWIGDANADVNGTGISGGDVVQSIAYIANNGHQFTGNVGIGIAPTVALDVAGGINVDATTGNNNILTSGTTIIGDGNSDTKIVIDGSSGGNTIDLLSISGGITIGGTSVTVSTLSGTGTRAVLASSAGVLSAPISDARKKKNFKTVANYVDVLGMLRNPSIHGVFYNWIDSARGKETEIGFTAQMFEKVQGLTGTMTKSGDKYLNYDRITSLLWEQNRLQQSTIDTQEVRIKALEAKVDKLCKRKKCK